MQDFEQFRELLLVKYATQVFKLVGQIVDQNQTSRFQQSFKVTLERLNFQNYELISELRHNLTHQDIPEAHFLESGLICVLRDIFHVY